MNTALLLLSLAVVPQTPEPVLYSAGQILAPSLAPVCLQDESGRWICMYSENA